MDVKADQGRTEPQEKRGPQTPEDPEMVIQQQLMDEERVLNALVVEGNKARQETMPESSRTYNPREPCHAPNQLQTSVPETVGDSSEVVNLSKSESTKTRKRRVGAGQGEIPTMVNDAPKALPRRGAPRAAKGTVRSQESDLRLIAGHGGGRNTAQQRREVPDDDGFEEDQLYRIHGMAPVGRQIDATSKPMMDLNAADVHKIIPAGDLKRKRDEVTEANRANTEDGGHGHAIAKPTLGVLPKENRDGLFEQSREARFKTTEVTSKRRKVVQRAGEDGPPTEDAHARGGRTSEAEEQTQQQRRIQPQRGVKITRNNLKSGATVGRWELKMAQANRTQRADSRRTTQKRLGMAELEVEAQRYQELSAAINKYLIVTIVEVLEDSKRTKPMNSEYTMAQVPQDLLENISRGLWNANVAGYYMAASLLIRQKKIDLHDLPNSAQLILKPVLQLLDAKSYEPCIHPDFRCTKLQCYEQWYVLCYRGEKEIPFTEFKQSYWMPEVKKYNKNLKTDFSRKAEIFSGEMSDKHQLMTTLYTRECIDLLTRKLDADCDMMGSQTGESQESEASGTGAGRSQIVKRAYMSSIQKLKREEGAATRALRREIAALHRQLATLKSKSENVQESTKSNEELVLEVDELRKEVARYKETISDLNKKIKTLHEDQERLESERTQHEQTIKTQSEKIGRLEQEKAAWEIERVELEGTREDSKNEFTMLQNKHSVEIRALAQKHEDQERYTQTEISDLKESIKILKEENKRDKEMRKRGNEMAETELQRLRTEATEHQKENKELTQKLADEGRNAKSTIDKQTTIITGLESAILSYIQTRVKWAKGLELHELRKQVESLRVQINNQSDADHGAIYELCNKIHMNRNFPSVDDELRHLKDEHKKAIEGGIEVVRQFFISMDRGEADSKDVEKPVKREEPDPNTMSSALQSAGLRCAPMLEHMKPFFSQEFRNTVGADMAQPTDMYNIYRPVFLLLQRFLQNKGTMKHKLSVLQEEHSECDKNLQRSKRSAEALQTCLDNKTKTAANNREELCKLKAQWSEVHELIKTALRLYETKSSTREDPGDEGSAESRIKTSGKALDRSSSRKADKNTDLPIGESFDKSRNQDLEQRIKDCLRKGDLADRAVLRRWHIMWCGCENFRIDGDVVSTTGTCTLHGVPATVSASSDASKLCYSMLEWMQGVFSYHQESLRALKVEVCNGEEEIDKLRQTGTEREATAKRTLELLEQNIAHETKRYDALKERFDTIEQGNSILNFVASVQDKTQNSDVVLEPRPPKSGKWANPQVITCLHTILCGCALDLSNLSELTFDPAKYNDCKRVFRSILPESIEAEIDEKFATGSKFLSTVAKRCKLEAKLVEDLKASLRARDALCRENEALKNEAGAKRADSKKIIHLHRRAFLDFARLIVEPFSEGFLQHGDKGSTKCKNREIKLNQVRLWLTPLEEGNVESDDEKLTAPIEICTGPEPADDTEKIFSQLVRVQEVANREQEFNKLVAVKVELQEKVANKTRQYEKLKNSFDTIEKHNLMVKFVVSVQDKAQHSNLALEPRLKTGDWANPEVIKCLHIILCGCTVSFSNVNETTFDPAKYKTCTSEFLSALPERITAHVYKEYEPYCKFLSAVAKSCHLEARLEDSNAISRANDEISQENGALKKQVEYKRAELKRIVHLHRKAFLDFARLIVEPFTEGFLQHGDERSVKGQSREVKLNEVRLWLTPLMEGNSKLKDDGLTAPVTIYTDSNSAIDIVEIFSLLGRMQDVAASEKDLKDARATLRSTEDEHRRNLEGLNERLKNVKARHTLLCETLRALSGSPASVQKFTGCLESGKIGTKENTERLHLLLSNASEAGLPKTHSVRGCQNTNCTAAFLHNFRLPAGGEIDAGPERAVNCDISDELSLLEQVKMFWVFKKGLYDKLYSTFARHGPQAADSNPVATQWPPDNLLSAADLLGALKIDSILSVLEQYIDEGEGREGKEKIHSTKQEKAVRRMAEFGGLDSKTISARLNCEKPGDRDQFLSQKREQGSTSDEDIENDAAKSMKTTALRRCERLIERITMIQSRSEEQETRQKRDLEKLWAICQEWLGLGDQWPHSYENITSGHGGKLAVGDQLAFIINAIEDAAQNVQNIERKYDNQYEEFKTKAKSDVELAKILRMTTWPSEVPGFPERILHKSRALQQIKGLCLEFNRTQFIFALKDFNAAKAESQTTECILDSAMKGGLYYEGLTSYLETASSKGEEVRLKISEGSDTSESNEVFSFYKPIIRLVLSLQRKDAEQASWISDCSRKMIDLYTKYGRSSCAVESGTKKPEEMMCNENAPLTSRLESLVTFVAELPSQKLDKPTHKFAGEDHHATKELNAAIAKSSEKIATFEKLVRIIQDAEAKLDKRYNDLKRNPDIARSVLGSMQLQSKEVSLPDRLEARLEQAGVIGFVEGFWNEWQLETGRVKLVATLSSLSSGLGNIDEAMIKQARKTAKDVGLYCEEFVNIFPMLERKYTAGAGASNEVFVLYKPMIEAAIFAGQGPLLSEAIMTLYASHGGNRGPLLPSRPEKDSVDLVPVKGSVVSNDIQIRDQTQPLTLRLRALMDFVASKSESATALPPVPADKNILREVEIIRQSWEEPNVDINGQLQGSGKPNRQRICNNPTEIRDTLTIHGKKVKIVRIKPRGKNYEFEVVDHNNERRMDLTSLSKILMEGTPSDVKDNADVIYAIFVRALVSVHPKVQLKKNDKKSEDLPKMIRFQHIKERVEKASPEMWLVQYRDGGQEEVSRGTISGWGLDAREQMKARR